MAVEKCIMFELLKRKSELLKIKRLSQESWSSLREERPKQSNSYAMISTLLNCSR